MIYARELANKVGAFLPEQAQSVKTRHQESVNG